MRATGKRRGWSGGTILVVVLIALVLGFVFGNSILSREESAQVSSSVMMRLEGWLRPVVSLFVEGEVSDNLLHLVVRKLAHFTEFAVLASLLVILLCLVRGTWRTHALVDVFFAALGCAVLDELLQSFTGRGSAVRDVVLDFCGATVGIVCTVALWEIIAALRRKK